jgi:UDP-N-acetylglucosamine 2-epimerase
MSQDWTANSDESFKNFMAHAEALYKEHRYVTLSTGRQRSALQNKALHKYCEMLAEALNDRGLDMTVVLSHHPEISWTKEAVKEKLWRPVQEAMLNKKSTTKADRNEYSKVYDELNKHLIDRHGVSVPWPEKRGANTN